MTISSTVRKAGPFSGTGVQTAFPFAFKVFATSDVLVVQTDSTGIENPLSLGAGYSVVLNADQDANPGGTVALSVALPAGSVLAITSAVPLNQGTSIPNMGGFYPKVIEQALDKLTITVQQVADVVSRSLRFALSDSGGNGALPTSAARAGKFLTFDAGGNPTVATGTGSDAALRTDLASILSGSSLVAYIQSGVGAVVRTVLDALRDKEVSVKDFGVTGDGSNETAKFNAAANAAATAGRVLNLQGLTILHDGGFSSNAATNKFRWRNGTIKQSPGLKITHMFHFTSANTVEMQGIKLDGNRANVSSANPVNDATAGIVVDGANSVVFDDIEMWDFRRFGVSIGPTIGCQNVRVTRVRARDFGLQNAGAAVSLGEAVMVQNSQNVTIDGFHYTNPSGTGDGQVLKAFYCGNVKVHNIYIDAASPSKVYPAASFVHCQNIEYNNITISGLCQVALENNSNLNQTYRDINTVGTPKALIQGTDGGVNPTRYSENTLIDGWTDTSTAVDPLLAFNIVGAKGLRLHNVTTPGTINISRDGIAVDSLRSEDIELERVSCGALNTLLVNGQKVVRDVTITGQWKNSGAGVTRAVDSTFGNYTNSGTPGVWLVREFSGSDVFQISGTIAADGGTFVWTAPTYINNTSAFSGEVLANTYLAASGANQFSQIKYNFYDYGAGTVAKNVVIDGPIPRNQTTLAVSRGARTLTFTNAEVDHVPLNIEARVAFINSGLPGQTATGSAVL